jgi:hypothetical protein
LSFLVAFTVKLKVPLGVAAVVLIVSVAVFELSEEPKETLLGLNEYVAPAGREVIIVKSAVNVPDVPPPVPLFTVTV